MIAADSGGGGGREGTGSNSLQFGSDTSGCETLGSRTWLMTRIDIKGSLSTGWTWVGGLGWTWVGGLGSQCLRPSWSSCLCAVCPFDNYTINTVSSLIDYMTSEPFRSTARIQHKNRIKHIDDTWNWGPVMHVTTSVWTGGQKLWTNHWDGSGISVSLAFNRTSFLWVCPVVVWAYRRCK